jgi:lysophospholipase L1-like esterase
VGILTSVKYLLAYGGLLPLLPIIAFQAKQVKASTLRLPCAHDNRVQDKCDKTAISLLHLGESTVAGVGVPYLSQGLTHSIVNQLSMQGTQIDWHVQAQNGATLSQLNQLDVHVKKPDLLIITLGVNDCTGLTPRSEWRKQLYLCTERFAGTHTQIFFTQIPNMSKFPSLPAPLSWFLGLRSHILDAELKQFCCLFHCQYIAVTLPIKAHWMAKDGYHPNAEGYQRWGKEIAQVISKTLRLSH